MTNHDDDEAHDCNIHPFEANFQLLADARGISPFAVTDVDCPPIRRGSYKWITVRGRSNTMLVDEDRRDQSPLFFFLAY